MSCWRPTLLAAALINQAPLSVAVQPRGLAEAQACYVSMLVDHLNFQALTTADIQALGPLVANEIAGATGAGRSDVLTLTGSPNSVAIQAGSSAADLGWLDSWPAAPSDSTLFSAKVINPVSCNFVAESSIQSPAFKQEILKAATKRLGSSAAITGTASISQVALTPVSDMSSTPSAAEVVAEKQAGVTQAPAPWETSAPNADSATNSRHTQLPWTYIFAGLACVIVVFAVTQCIIRKMSRKGRVPEGFLSVGSQDSRSGSTSNWNSARKAPPGGYGVTGH